MAPLTKEQRSENAKKAAATRRANAAAAARREEKTNSSQNWNWLPWVLLALALALALLLWHPWNTNTCAECDTNTTPVPFNPYTWTESTCTSLGNAIGLKLTPLQEGDFYACIYSGPVVPINIPAEVIADVDRGGIQVAIGPVYTESSNVTFRQWDGRLESACAQVENLTAYGQTQEPKFTASPLNFSCPEQ